MMEQKERGGGEACEAPGVVLFYFLFSISRDRDRDLVNAYCVA